MRVAILGAGQAGCQAAVSLRQLGHDGSIVMIGDEPAPPYQRPPLSKGYLKGDLDADRLWLRPSEFYSENAIELRLGCTATRIDLAARRVDIENGAAENFDALVVATGARPRRLPVPGADLAGVLVLRTLADVDLLRPLVVQGARIVVVGAGYIGLETAAVARQLGAEVTVLEAAPQVLGRVAGPEIAAFYTDVHRKAGVDIRLGVKLEGFEAAANAPGRVGAVRLGDGTRIACDAVVVGVGVLPNLEAAQAAGLACANGIVTNEDCRASADGASTVAVWAVGDVASRPLVHYGRPHRLESVHNAIEGGKIAAASILGAAHPAEEVPWFWSDQYDLKLQTAGLWTGCDVRVVRGDIASGRFAVFYLATDHRVLAVDAVNAAPEFVVGKRLVAASARVAPGELADTSITMKEIAARHC